MFHVLLIQILTFHWITTDLSYNLLSVIFLRISRTQCGWNYTVHSLVKLVPITYDLHLNYLYPPLFSLFHFHFHHSIC